MSTTCRDLSKNITRETQFDKLQLSNTNGQDTFSEDIITFKEPGTSISENYKTSKTRSHEIKETVSPMNDASNNSTVQTVHPMANNIMETECNIPMTEHQNWIKQEPPDESILENNSQIDESSEYNSALTTSDQTKETTHPQQTVLNNRETQTNCTQTMQSTNLLKKEDQNQIRPTVITPMEPQENEEHNESSTQNNSTNSDLENQITPTVQQKEMEQNVNWRVSKEDDQENTSTYQMANQSEHQKYLTGKPENSLPETQLDYNTRPNQLTDKLSSHEVTHKTVTQTLSNTEKITSTQTNAPNTQSSTHESLNKPGTSQESLSSTAYGHLLDKWKDITVSIKTTQSK